MNEKLADFVSTMDKAAVSVLESDRAKAPQYGGQKLGHIERAEVVWDDDIENPAVRLHGKNGDIAQSAVLPTGIYRPDKRETRPADVHDAVFNAVHATAAQLAA